MAGHLALRLVADRSVFPSWQVKTDGPTGMSFQVGPDPHSTRICLRERFRPFDGDKGANSAPGVQLAFLVSPVAVEACHRQLVQMGVKILEPVTDQPRGHRTVYFSDPEGNQLEIYADVPAFAGEPRPLL